MSWKRKRSIVPGRAIAATPPNTSSPTGASRRRSRANGSLPATFRFEARPDANRDSIRKLLEKRHASQPIGAWSCGSVFTNPPGGHAADLIERAGLKGHRIGGAAVSDKHANFIINEGEATAADLEALVRHVQATVERVHGVRLVPEVRVIGEAA